MVFLLFRDGLEKKPAAGSQGIPRVGEITFSPSSSTLGHTCITDRATLGHCHTLAQIHIPSKCSHEPLPQRHFRHFYLVSNVCFYSWPLPWTGRSSGTLPVLRLVSVYSSHTFNYFVVMHFTCANTMLKEFSFSQCHLKEDPCLGIPTELLFTSFISWPGLP